MFSVSVEVNVSDLAAVCVQYKGCFNTFLSTKKTCLRG